MITTQITDCIVKHMHNTYFKCTAEYTICTSHTTFWLYTIMNNIYFIMVKHMIQCITYVKDNNSFPHMSGPDPQSPSSMNSVQEYLCSENCISHRSPISIIFHLDVYHLYHLCYVIRYFTYSIYIQPTTYNVQLMEYKLVQHMYNT